MSISVPKRSRSAQGSRALPDRPIRPTVRPMPAEPDAPIIEATRRWVQGVVIGHGLCPFARPVAARLRYAISRAGDLEALLVDLAAELTHLLQTPPATLPTSLLIVPGLLADFDDYLDALALIEAAVEHAGLAGVIQVASFHPDYRFADAPADDPAHYSNRSPWPMFHLLREDDVTHAVASHPDPEGIPQRNIAHLRALGGPRLAAELAACRRPSS